MIHVLDTNIALYQLHGRLLEPLPVVPFFISVITEIELLSYSKMTGDEDERIRAFLDDITIVGLNREIVSATVSLRREYRLKLPDAIIGATALVLNAVLFSNDSRFTTITEIEVVSLPLRSG